MANLLYDLEPADDVQTGAVETERWELRWLKEIPPLMLPDSVMPRLQIRRERVVYTRREPFGYTEWGPWEDIPTHEVHIDAVHE